MMKKMDCITVTFLKNKRYYIWGTGRKARELNAYCKEYLDAIEIAGYIDNDISKQGKLFHQKRIYAPDILEKDQTAHIIIANVHVNKIKQQIKEQYPWYIDRVEHHLFFQRLKLISRYENTEDYEIKEVIEYLKDHDLSEFNYSFTEKYHEEDVSVCYDDEKQLYYTLHENKKMYFSRAYKNEKAVRKYYSFVCMEQDVNSPHRYLDDYFVVPENAVVIDAGVAEGNFALSIIDRVKRIYLIEPDADWIAALEATFEPYKDKVTIINKRISDYINDYVTTLDYAIDEPEIDFIKLDIEGDEYYALKGAERLISSSPKVKCAVCVYHQEFAEHAICQLLEKYGMEAEPTRGYMWFQAYEDIIRGPVLRRGVIRARKE